MTDDRAYPGSFIKCFTFCLCVDRIQNKYIDTCINKNLIYALFINILIFYSDLFLELNWVSSHPDEAVLFDSATSKGF